MNRLTLLALCLLLLHAEPAAASSGTGPSESPASADATLRRAFERERALLLAEREALQDELQNHRTTARRQEAQRAREIRRASERLSRLRTRATALEEEAVQLERALGSRSHESNLLAASLDQAVETLVRHGVELPAEIRSDPDSAALLTHLFDRGAELVTRWRGVVKEEGVFFLADGRETHGTILHLGRVAALGVSEDGGGVLGPAGADRLVVVDAERLADARAVLDARPPDLVPLFLFAPGAPALDAPAETGVMSFLQRGGMLIWPIVILAALALLLVLERTIALLFVRASRRRLLDAALAAVAANEPERAQALCEKQGGALARVLRVALRHRDSGRETYEDAVGQAMLAERHRIERFLPALQVIAGAAPLLGLLGTVTGMISTFDVITDHGTGDPKLLSGGISEALITTQLGLMVAIPTLLLHGVFAGWAARQVGALERSALEASVALLGGRSAETTHESVSVDDVGGGDEPDELSAAMSEAGVVPLSLASGAARDRGARGR